MQRLIYDSETKTIVALIDPCEGTCTGTPYQMAEGTPEQIAALIAALGLEQPDSDAG